MKLVVATRNRGKLTELEALLGDLGVELLSLDDVPPVAEVVEDRDTFAGNAEKKARQVAAALDLPVLADDSGLEVDALGGAPGVFSARYAGPDASDADNNHKLLAALAKVAGPERTARFRCVLALVDPSGQLSDDVAFFDGICEGIIVDAPRGDGGFGYDPLFSPAGEYRTMAELEPDEKNRRSHRADASRKLRAYLSPILTV